VSRACPSDTLRPAAISLAPGGHSGPRCPREAVEMALAHAVENKVERPTGAATRSISGAGWRDGDAYSQRLGEMNGAPYPGRSLPRPRCRRRLRWVPTLPPEGSAG
jgi:hypothetical protein